MLEVSFVEPGCLLEEERLSDAKFFGAASIRISDFLVPDFEVSILYRCAQSISPDFGFFEMIFHNFLSLFASHST
jgi:hypothetical protein